MTLALRVTIFNKPIGPKSEPGLTLDMSRLTDTQ